MRRYWQRRPLLVRQAIPGFVPPLDPQALLELASDEAVESRFVSRHGKRWSLEEGPFEAEALPPLSRRNWTLLVQGVELHLDAAHELLSRFRFIPDARVDDLMISLASDGGGVGPHLDSYDVFLLQAWGKRRWRIGPVRSPKLVEGLPLRILADFEADQEWLLEPGDMLYLPPGWGHDGIAEGPCMTCSIGFRAPSRHEFLSAFLAEAAEAPGGANPRFADRRRLASDSPARIPDDLHQTLTGWAASWRPEAKRAEAFIGRFLTEPKPSVWFEPPARGPKGGFASACRSRPLQLDRRTRMLWRGRQIFINGECVEPHARARPLLRRLAERRVIEPVELAALAEDAALLGLLETWFEAGWLHLGRPSTERKLRASS
jgi:50S ribosomal protein L16 3-hydroxylase